jgi:hypothetical protein
MSQLKLPKTRLPVVLGLPGRTMQAEVFLSDYARCHAGPERLDDLLAGEEAFLPAAELNGPVQLVARHSILWAMVPEMVQDAAAEGAPIEAGVEIALDDGSSLTGQVRFDAPSERTRLVDCLNDAPAFVPLFAAGSVLFVNRAHVVSVTPLADGGPGR